jgi:chromosome segregation ATPase
MFYRRSIKILVALCLWASATGPAVLAADFRVGPTTSLDNTMKTFKDGIETLIAENKSLLENNNGLRMKIRAMREQIRMLKRDEERLLAQMNTADKNDQKRSGSIAGLQSSLEDNVQVLAGLKNEQLTIETDLKGLDAQAGEMQKQVEALQGEIQDPMSIVDPATGLGPRLTSLQSERDGLKSDLAGAIRRVELLKQELQNLSATAGSGAAQVKVVEKEHTRLKEDIERKEAALRSLKQLTSNKSGLLEQLSNEKSASALLAQRQDEVAALDLELQTLQNIVGALEEKAALFDKGEYRESPQRKKKEEFLKDLSMRNMSLKSELARSEQEMVNQDKKKSSLEKVLYKPKY